MRQDPIRLYIAVDSDYPVSPDRSFYDVYTEVADDSVLQFITGDIKGTFTIKRPSLNWPLRVQVPDRDPVRVPKLILALEFSGEDARHFAEELANDRSGGRIGRFHADPLISLADHWCPVGPDQVLFGTRAEARRLIGADAFGSLPAAGNPVNVVIVDRGLNKDFIDATYGAGRYIDGWAFNPVTGDSRPAQLPGQTPVEDAAHGLMLARNILDLAPHARLWDLPLLPPRIGNIEMFLDEAHAAYNAMLTDIYARGGIWILANAWAIFDRQSEVPLGGYTENISPAPTDLHAFTLDVAAAVDHKIDVIFCAGNCGEFCPDGRCGANDCGPGHSIWGANSHHRVLTVGAVRTDGVWIGYSSQGPGQPRLGRPNAHGPNRKPDICLPSGFVEDFDAHTVNRGTSAATGVAAGVVAAIRSKWDSQTVRPELLKIVLNGSARQPSGHLWDPRFGHGILDIDAALALLP